MNKKTKALILSMIPKWVATAIILGIVIFNFLPGQTEIRPELVPYQIVPLDPEPDCRLELGIVLMHPYDFQDMPTVQQEETLNIIYKRISYEMVNPNRQAGMFQIDDRIYHLIRIPYTGVSENYGQQWH